MPSERVLSLYMIMAALVLTGGLVAVSVLAILDLGLVALTFVIPVLMLALPLIAWLLWDAGHAAWHDNILWDQYPGNNKRHKSAKDTP